MSETTAEGASLPIKEKDVNTAERVKAVLGTLWQNPYVDADLAFGVAGGLLRASTGADPVDAVMTGVSATFVRKIIYGGIDLFSYHEAETQPQSDNLLLEKPNSGWGIATLVRAWRTGNVQLPKSTTVSLK